MDASLHLRCETDATRRGTTNLDGHNGHILSLVAVEIARKHGAVMLSLLFHSTHRMQPLDVTFFIFF
jgi:hypothetical protein